MGIAIWKDNRLSEWQIKAFKGPWSERKLRDIIFSVKEMLDRYKATHLVLKIPNCFHSSTALEKVVMEIQSIAHSMQAKVRLVELMDLRQLCDKSTKFSKGELMKIVAQHNVVLQSLYNRELRNRNPYYTKMFEAIALVLLSRQENFRKQAILSPFPQYYR